MIGIENAKARHVFRFCELPILVCVKQTESGMRRAMEFGPADTTALANVKKIEGECILPSIDSSIAVRIQNCKWEIGGQHLSVQLGLGDEANTNLIEHVKANHVFLSAEPPITVCVKQVEGGGDAAPNSALLIKPQRTANEKCLGSTFPSSGMRRAVELCLMLKPSSSVSRISEAVSYSH